MRSYPLLVGRRFFSASSDSTSTNKRLASFVAVLAMSGLVLGVALMIIVLSVMNGFDSEMRTRVLGVVAHIQFFSPGGINNWSEKAELVRKHPEVRAVMPFTKLDGMLNFHGTTKAAKLLGVSSEGFSHWFKSFDASKSYDDLGAGDMLLPVTLAEKLGIKAGDNVTLIVPGKPTKGHQALPRAQVFKVVALYQTHTALDTSIGLISLESANKILGYTTEVGGLRLVINDVFSAREVAYQLINELPSDFYFSDWFHSHGNLYQAIQMSRKLVGLLVFLVIAIAVFNLISMLVMTVVEKRGDIAILKTLGASNSGILSIFIVQGAMIGVLGTFLGAALGVLGAYFVSDLITGVESLLGFQFLSLDVYPIDYIPSDLRSSDVLSVIVVSLLLNFLATLYPAWRAANLQPAQVLSYE